MSGEYAACIVCGSTRLVKMYVVGGFTIVRCGECSLLFVKERLSQEELNKHYELSEGDYIYSDPTNIENLNYYYYKLRSLIEKISRKGKILDVGCSGGYFLDVMEGWQRYGIELSRPDAEKVKTKYGDNIHSGTLEDYKCPDSYFDVITLQDVLDHMLDPVGALKKCNLLLKSGGLIVIKVHNISCLFAKLWGPRFYAIVPPVHLTYFNKVSLQEALSRSGFDFLSHKYIGHILFLKTIPYRFSRGRQEGLSYWLYKVLNGSSVGNIRIRKNLHDIITVIARKNGSNCRIEGRGAGL